MYRSTERVVGIAVTVCSRHQHTTYDTVRVRDFRGILDFGQVFDNMPSGLRNTCFLALRYIKKQL